MHPELEEKLAAWIEESHLQGLIITCTVIHIRALKLIKTPELEFADKKPSDYVASVGWCTRFMSRQKFSMRAKIVRL